MKRKILKKLLILLVIIFAVFAGIAGIILLSGYSLYRDTIRQDTISNKFSEIRNQENFVPLDELPKNFINAVISVEDNRFYDHSAIDLISIGRAIFVNIKGNELVEGGSTITQQVAKNVFFTQEKTLKRKIAEIYTAFDIEEHYSKDEILEIYVNINFYGSGYYGIKDACNGYLKKEPTDMTLAECALLAGIPNAPSVYSPNVNPDLAKKRQLVVLNSMVEHKYITQEEADNAIAEIK